MQELIKAAALQMTSTDNQAENLEQAERLIKEAANEQADLVALPENFSLMSETRAEILKHAEDEKGPATTALKNWAKEHDLWIVGGSIPYRTKEEKVTNTCILVSPKGKIEARYDKIHLFDVEVSKDRSYHESRNVQGGEKTVCAATPLGNLGLSICYDVRFPELYRKLADQDAEILFVPSAFTVPTGEKHWDLLTRTRAVENQCFLIAPAQGGDNYEGRQTWGHTRIIDPWGEILTELPEGPGLISAKLESKRLEKIRKEFPALNHRKL